MIYAIAAGVVLLAGVVGAIALALSGFGGVMAALFLVIPMTVVNLLLVRVGTEAIVVYFRLGEDVRALRDAGLPLAA